MGLVLIPKCKRWLMVVRRLLKKPIRDIGLLIHLEVGGSQDDKVDLNLEKYHYLFILVKQTSFTLQEEEQESKAIMIFS